MCLHMKHKRQEICHLTSRPMEVRLMLSSWFCRPKLPATSTTIWRHVQGMVGRKSVTTNCRHWKAVRINDSLKGNKKHDTIISGVNSSVVTRQI